jgi:hypothetical protein
MVPTLPCVVRRLTILTGVAIAALAVLIGLVKAADARNIVPVTVDSVPTAGQLGAFSKS